MKTKKVVGPITEGINRRFFAAIEAVVSIGSVSSLQAFCRLHGFSESRYREMRRTYGTTPNPNKPSRYKNVELEALYSLNNSYNISAEWLLSGRGKMFRHETKNKV